jgi:uncharacterized protein (DUF983 family)
MVESAWRALRRQLCPKCRKGPMFRGRLWRGSLAMHERCPVCGLKFERETGYFVGALYFSFLLSVPGCLLIFWLIWHWSGWSVDLAMVAAFLAYLPAASVTMRWARVLWLHMDWHFDPDEPQLPRE